MKIAVIGAGAWGTAFSIHLAKKGLKPLVWVYEKELYDILKKERVNTYYLPSFILPEEIQFTTNLEDAYSWSDSIVIATPSFALRTIITQCSQDLVNKHVLILTKGLEVKSHLRMSEVVKEIVGNDFNIAVLSGPSFAKEVAERLFTLVVVASKNKELASYFQKLIHDEDLRVYTSEDIIGVELGGAMKNVMAIGTGIIQGMHLGTNTQAAFVTRALAEIKRLGKVLGAQEVTFMGLSGIGDLILTSYGGLSRNRWFGIELAKGRKPDEILNSQNVVIEGYYTTRAAFAFSQHLNVEMPITEELYKIIYEGKDIGSSLTDIKKRSLKEERE
jgi:glycerol-3-phosphate dehydrogenase (NAD(P)+)